ncbi:hypothetical protein EDD17DRAFT_1517346 [Pisolithus thermaeus]|nr:hypothetical protein EDD17DRAFT_1517346 [Pisolithus thermaeus]
MAFTTHVNIAVLKAYIRLSCYIEATVFKERCPNSLAEGHYWYPKSMNSLQMLSGPPRSAVMEKGMLAVKFSAMFDVARFRLASKPEDGTPLWRTGYDTLHPRVSPTYDTPVNASLTRTGQWPAERQQWLYGSRLTQNHSSCGYKNVPPVGTAFSSALLTPHDIQSFVRRAIEGELGRFYRISSPPTDRPVRICADVARRVSAVHVPTLHVSHPMSDYVVYALLQLSAEDDNSLTNTEASTSSSSSMHMLFTFHIPFLARTPFLDSPDGWQTRAPIARNMHASLIIRSYLGQL